MWEVGKVGFPSFPKRGKKSVASHFHRRSIQNPKPKEECMGIKVNIWNRAKVRRYYLDEIR